jgi:hypothetical protein
MSVTKYTYFCNQKFIFKSVEPLKRVLNFFIILREKSSWLFDTLQLSKVPGVKKNRKLQHVRVSGFLIENKSVIVSPALHW